MHKHHRIGAALAAITGSLLLASTALATPRCNNETTRGQWVYTCEGTLPALPTGAQTATRILGTCSASRTGFFECQGTVNLGGTILPQGLRGQASTQASCRGTIVYEQTIGGVAAGTLEIEYVVSDRGDSINGLPTNSGGVLSCSLKRQERWPHH